MEDLIGLVDVDGVLADFVTGATEYATNEFGELLDFSDPELAYALPGLTKAQKATLLTDKKLYSSLEPYPGVSDHMKSLKELGTYIIVVSARPVYAHITIQWLIDNNIPFDLFLPATNEARIQELVRRKATFLIDDTFGNAYEASKECDFPFLLDRPWNAFDNPEVIRISSILDATYIIKKDMENLYG
jgi:uncharacterized HAD superfamily protein